MRVTEFSPLFTCLGDPSKFRMMARLSPPPGDLVKILEPVFEKAVYSGRMNALLIKSQSTLITVYASGAVTMTQLCDAGHARALLNDILIKINQLLAGSGGNEPESNRGSGTRPDPMEINARLPRTNCKQCGVESCFGFSILVAYSEAALERCKPLQQACYFANRMSLEELITR